MAGWCLGDGLFTKSGFGAVFGYGEKYAIKEVTEHLELWRQSVPCNKNDSNRAPVKINWNKHGRSCMWLSKKKEFMKLITDKFGFEKGKYSKDKIIPNKIKKASPIQIASFLSGLFSADGCITKSHNLPSIQLSSTSYNILVDTQQLLKCFGIHSRINYYKLKDGREQGNLCIHGETNKERFTKYINFLLCPAKKEKLYINYERQRERSHTYAKVKNIKYIGIEKVYDISMENRHVFIANSMAVHNCCLSSICLPRFLEEKILKNDEIKVYSIDNCKFCVLAKRLLDSRKVHYETINVNLKNNKSGIKTFPQIVINGELIGGYTKLREYLRPVYNYEKLEDISGQMVRNLNKVIDVNLYPVPETEYSNFKHRPLGIGVQGLADVFCRMRFPFDSKEALEMNNKIFETIYYGAMKASLELSKRDGSYETFKGSPLSKGLFQFNLWGLEDSKRYDWESLRQDIMKTGVRNSLLVACMPTASTSQIMGNNETIEPITSNMYVRRTLSGEFIVSNKYMIDDLRHLGLWDSKLKDRIIANNGSIQNISGIPESVKNLYRTSWELKQKALMDLSVGRGPFVCQTQSLNLFFEEPTTKILTSAMFYAWKKGLKTGVYYVRSRPKTQAQQFTIDPKLLKNKELQEKQNENDDEPFIQTDEKICYSCSG